MSPSKYFLLMISIIGMASSGPIVRLCHAPSLAIVAWRLIFAWPLLALIAWVRKENWPLARGSAAGIFLAGHWLSWVIAVKNTSIAAAAFLVATGTLWVAFLSKPLLKESIPRTQWIGMGVALLGICFILFEGDLGVHRWQGDLWALLSSWFWVGYIFIGRKARLSADFFSYTASVYGAAGIVIITAALLTNATLTGFDNPTWIAFGAMAVMPTLIGHGLMNYLIRFISPFHFSLWALIEPLWASLIAWPLFSEVPSLQVFGGGMFTLLGIGIGVAGASVWLGKKVRTNNQ